MFAIFALLNSAYVATALLELDARISEFSGLVANVVIGTPGQKLRMALDLSGTVPSFVYSGLACPPLVGRACFNAEVSTSLQNGEAIDTEPIQMGWGSAVGFKDMTNISPEDVNLISVKTLDVINSMKFRDVGGVVDFGRSSMFLANRDIVLQSNLDGEYEWVHITDRNIEEGVIWTAVGANDDPNWSFQTTAVDVGPVSLSGTRIVIDFQSDRIVLPASIRDQLISEVGIDYAPSGQDLMIQRGTDFELRIFVEGFFVRIPLQQLRDSSASSWNSSNQQYRLLVMFGDVDYIQIGKQLLSCIDKLVLGSDGRVGLVPASKRSPPVVRPPLRLAPRFAFPEIALELDGGNTVFLKAEGGGDLCLGFGHRMALEAPRKVFILSSFVLEEFHGNMRNQS